jgi:hypothetical protein
LLANTLASAAAFITALAGLLAVLKTKKDVKEVHHLVNQQSTDQIARITQLREQLAAAGIIPDEIPPRGTI